MGEFKVAPHGQGYRPKSFKHFQLIALPPGQPRPMVLIPSFHSGILSESVTRLGIEPVSGVSGRDPSRPSGLPLGLKDNRWFQWHGCDKNIRFFFMAYWKKRKNEKTKKRKLFVPIWFMYIRHVFHSLHNEMGTSSFTSGWGVFIILKCVS